ncbi:MAG: hypothetical protein A2V63_01910 [Candidatus Eisenbacteria bacterium RBG_19FT_COMBO_70_11]|nr:MAG: hypothetical protein A2V63_01910 [Candidatus Eisenbacteria bacterium RBG_19FT_COMBO_70_11]
MPSVCASMMARVRGVTASSRRVTSTLQVASWMSSSTGTHWFCRIGAMVVGKPAATPMTSSPGLSRCSRNSGEVSAVSASRLALEPLLHSMTSRAPRNAASFGATSCVKRPSVHQQSSEASSNSSISSWS